MKNKLVFIRGVFGIILLSRRIFQHLVPPQKYKKTPSLWPSSFSSLPRDTALEILARVPKRYYPILSCVSKTFRALVRSPEIHTIRSLLGKDSVYICFIDKTSPAKPRNWFTFRRIENNPNENLFVSVKLAFPYDCDPNLSIIAVGTEIFFICGSQLWIFDTRSERFRRGPNMQVNRCHKSVGLVGEKIYVIGGYRDYDIKAESFDLKTQTWEAAPIPEERESEVWITAASVSLDRKVYGLSFDETIIVYDTRDGSCEYLEMPNDIWWETGVCAIDNVLYVYYGKLGLLWYDTILMLWRVVNGLNLDNIQSVGMAEYYGKLVFLWIESGDVWCRMIALDRSEVEIRGTAEQSQLLGVVPCGYRLQPCLSLSG